jgi:hypothetical protein
MRVRNSRRDMPGLGALPMSRKDGLARAWNDAGLVDIEVDSLTIRMDYGSISGRRSTARRGLLPNTLAPAETKLALRNLVEAAYLDGEPDGPRSYAATAWAGRVGCHGRLNRDIRSQLSHCIVSIRARCARQRANRERSSNHNDLSPARTVERRPMAPAADRSARRWRHRNRRRRAHARVI